MLKLIITNVAGRSHQRVSAEFSCIRFSGWGSVRNIFRNIFFVRLSSSAQAIQNLLDALQLFELIWDRNESINSKIFRPKLCHLLQVWFVQMETEKTTSKTCILFPFNVI